MEYILINFGYILCGVFWAWTMMSLAAAGAVVDIESYKGRLHHFKEHLELCEVHGECPLEDSRFHRWHESIEWKIALRHPKHGLRFAMFLNYFLQIELAPIWWPLKLITGKKFV